MAENWRQLRFRRHLCALALLVLLNELRYDLAGQTASRSAVRPERWTRVKRASAYEIHSALSEQQQQQQQPAGSFGPTLAVSNVYRHNTNNEANAFTRALAAIRDALPVINLNYSILSKPDRFAATGQLDKQIDDYYDERFPADMTLDELHLMSVRAAQRTIAIPLHTSWGYATRELARQGSLPVLDDDLCALQLNHLARRLEHALKQAAPGVAASPEMSPAFGNEPPGHVMAASPIVASPVDNFEARQIYRTGDLEIMRLMDTFGRVPSDLLRGNTRWYGSYSSCMRTRLPPPPPTSTSTSRSHQQVQQQEQDQQQTIKFRYCMGAYRSQSWRDSHELHGVAAGAVLDNNRTASKWMAEGSDGGTTLMNHPMYFLRLGLCLPEACDSSALERPDNARSLERLLKFNLAKPFNADHYKLADLYCLPDSRSPLRQIPLAGKLLLVVAALWLALVATATAIHLNVEKFYLKTVERIRRQEQQNRQTGSQEAGDVAAAAAAAVSDEAASDTTEDDKNQFRESDIFDVKLNVIKLCIYLRDKSRQLVPGIDLVDCLSLYSNWLRYTKGIKLAMVKMHERERSTARRRLRNERMVESLHLGGKSPRITWAHEGDTNRNSNGSGQALSMDMERDSTKKADPHLERIRRQLTGSATSGQLLQADDKQQCLSHEDETAKRKQRVDTSSLNALKVIALVWVIAGHCIFYLGSVMSNGAILKDILPTLPAFALANGSLYITEIFFIITGCLTAYLTFNHTTKLVSASTVFNGHNHDGQLELDERTNPTQRTTTDSTTTNPTKRRDNEATEVVIAEPNKPERAPMVAVMERRIFGVPFLSLMLLNRYLRILPTYLLVYAFVKLVSVYAGGAGQLWDYVVSANSMRRACVEEPWWPVFTLTTNFVDIYKHCIVGGWFLSADMQFALTSVPLILLLAYAQRSSPSSSSRSASPSQQLRRRQQQPARVEIASGEPGHSPLTSSSPTDDNGGQHQQQQQSAPLLLARPHKRLFLAYALIVGLGCLSALAAIVRSMVASRVDLSYIVKFSPHTMAMLSENIMMYTNSVFRFRAFAAGFLLGHLLYCYEFKLLKLPAFVQRHGAKLAVVIFACGFSVMFAPIFLYGKIVLSHDMTGLLMVLSASGIDLFLGSLLFLICIGKAPKAILFVLNSPLWSLLSSLSLSAFLVHTEIIILLTSQLDPPPAISFALLLFVFSATLLLTYSTAFVLYLTFEMPISRLIDSAMRTCICMNRNRRE